MVAFIACDLNKCAFVHFCCSMTGGCFIAVEAMCIYVSIHREASVFVLSAQIRQKKKKVGHLA